MIEVPRSEFKWSHTDMKTLHFDPLSREKLHSLQEKKKSIPTSELTALAGKTVEISR